MKKNIHNVAIVGLGHIGKLHAEIINQFEQLKVIALVDITTLENNDLPVFSSIKECNASFPELDLYIIASPNSFHYEQAKEALELKKNVLVEKPITLHKAQVIDLINTANKNKVRLFSSLQLRYSPVISHVKTLCEKNLLGQLYLINVECFWNRNSNYYKKSCWHGTKHIDGGILFTQFSHFMDILHYLTGKIELLNHTAENFSHQDCTEFPDSGILQFRSGKTLGSMIYTTSTYEKNFQSSITIIAEKGTIKIGGQYMNELLYHNVEGIEPPEIDCSFRKFHKNLYEDILQAIKNNTPALADAENTTDFIDFIETAMKN